MLLKTADDKSKRLSLLEDLQKSHLLDAKQKTWLRQELGRFRKGIQGERDSAYYLDQYFKGGENHVLLHDLRFVVDGDVAQIDHLIINRGFGMYLVETKNYAGSLMINDHGEFTAEYDDDRFGIPSPIEQSRRHERILKRLLSTLDIANRTGAPLACYHVVMLHPKAIIQRPPAKAFDTSNVIKADQFPTWHSQFVEKTVGFTDVLKMVVNVRALDTIKEWGEKLVRQHRPANQLDLPEFMQPRVRASASAGKAQQVSAPANITEAPSPQPTVATQAHVEGGQSIARKLVCAHCREKITFAEGKFCWNNEKRFGGLQYCREHQALF
ncbi:MAG: nuclease-related domain-containing protein [Telluria sp.]|nr:nuclease-related domain-containing protein [Telluria sp.]